MPRKALKCSIELKLHAVTCPGTYVKDKEDVHLTVCLMGKHKRTQSVPPSFPFLFHEKLKFERIFWDALDPGHLTEILDEEHVLIELIQESDIVRGGVVLADYECSAREFLYPYPTLAPTYAGVDREVLMRRTLHFDGISPKLEFSTKTVIKEIPSSAVDELRDITSIITSTSETSEISEDSTDVIPKKPTNKHRSRSKTRSKSNTVMQSSSRARSASPSMKKRLANLSINDTNPGDKPPFVVRKVDEHLLSSAPPKPDFRPCTPKKIHNSSANSGNSRSVMNNSYPVIMNGAMNGYNTTRYDNNTLAAANGNNSAGENSDYCEHCQHPHTDRQCTVCKLYKRYIGERYWGHAYHYHPNKSKHNHVKVHREPVSNNKLKVNGEVNSGVNQRQTDPEISDSPLSEHDSLLLSESDGKLDDFVPLEKYDSEDNRNTYSQPNNDLFTPNNKHVDITPPYSPKTVLLHPMSEPALATHYCRAISPSFYHRRRLADRYCEPYSPANKIHEKVERLTRTHKHFDPPLLLPSNSKSVESLDMHTYRGKHLDNSYSGDSQYSDTGYGSSSRSRRRLFDESLDKVYTRLFREAQSSY